MDPKDEPRTLTVDEAARELGIGRNQAYEAARRGEIPTIRIGKRILVLKEPLKRLLNAQYSGGLMRPKTKGPAALTRDEAPLEIDQLNCTNEFKRSGKHDLTSVFLARVETATRPQRKASAHARA